MKKLRLKALSLGAREILNRDQLRRITGGSCSTDYDCGAGSVCNSLNECTADPNQGGSGSNGDPSGCDNGTYHCTCSATNTDIGCMTPEQCASEQCPCSPQYPLGC